MTVIGRAIHAAGAAGIAYLLAGLAVLRRILRRHFSDGVVLATLVSITWGTNLFHYGVFDGTFSHAFAFFLVCCWILIIERWWELERPTWRLSLALGIVAALIAMMILAPIAAMLIQAMISRSREYDADAGGASIAGGPHGLVNALKKIDARSRAIPLDANPATAHMFIIKPFSGQGLLGLFSTHPPTEKRIQALLEKA